MKFSAKQKKNYNFFTSQLKKLVKKIEYNNKWVVINDSKILAVYDHFGDALTFACLKAGKDFIIQEVTEAAKFIGFLSDSKHNG